MTPPAAAAAPAVRPRRAPAPRGPRRVSGPARRAPASTPRPRVVRRERGVALGGLVRAFEALAQHRLLDRLIRGRTWIFIVAFALIGIVALQLGLLKLNGGIGRALEREGLLQRQNAALSIENSELAAGQRVEAHAGKLGMSFVPAGELRFLAAGGHGEASKAAAALSGAAREQAARTAEAAAASSSEASSSTESEASGTSSESESSGSESSSGEAPASSESSVASSEAAGSASGSGSSEAEAASGAAPSEAAPAAGSAAAQSAGGSQAGADRRMTR